LFKGKVNSITKRNLILLINLEQIDHLNRYKYHAFFLAKHNSGNAKGSYSPTQEY